MVTTSAASRWPGTSRFCIWIFCVVVLWSVSGAFQDVSREPEGPMFTNEPPLRVDFANSTGTTVECAVRGSPQPSVEWRRVDGTSASDIVALRRSFTNGTLIFFPFRAEDYRADVHSVTYLCHASNPLGTVVSREMQVRAVVLQVYEVQVYDEYAIRGNTAVMRCHIPSFVKDYVRVVSWVEESAYGSATVNTGGRYLITSTGELHISEVTTGDNSNAYRCRTSHRLTGEVRLSAASPSGRLYVTEPRGSVPPRITDHRSAVHAVQGETVLLPCAAQGFPVPTYSWFAKVSEMETLPISPSDRIRQVGGTLILANALILDAGTYVCEVTNSMGSVRIETVLTVSAPLSAYIYPPRQVVDVGQSATLTCVISGYPFTQVTWLKDGKPLLTDTINHVSQEVLRLDSVHRRDRGMYQCFVNNYLEVVQGSAELSLGDTGPEFLRVFADKVVVPGAFVSLECAISGSPTPQVTWTLDGERLTDRNTRVTSANFVDNNSDVISLVNISRARVEDGGEYTCVATNAAGKIHHTARLGVQGPPFIRLQPEVSAVAGTDLVMRCYVTGHPIDSVHWERDQRILPVNLRQKIFTNGTLLVQNVQKALDEGRYACVARAGTVTERTDTNVSVMAPPKIIPFSFQDEHLQEGTRARIQCVLSEGDLPVTITWLKDGRTISPGHGIDVRDLDDFSSMLTVSSVQSQHNGNYTCRATNKAAATSYTTELSVNVPPRWITQPQDAYVLLGANIVLPCRADGFPQPSVTWMKAVGDTPGDYRDIAFGMSRVKLHEDGSLQFFEVKETDQGYYLCKASNGIGAGLSELVYLSIHVPAYFQTKNRNVTAKKGGRAELLCEAYGDKPLTVTWTAHRDPIRKNSLAKYKVNNNYWEKGTLSELLIDNVNRDDGGLYPCVATNPYGQDQANVYLSIQEPPEPPTNIRVDEVGSRRIGLVWTPTFDGNAPISLYIIQFKENSKSWQEDSRNLTASGYATNFALERLQPSTRYHARIYAKNEIGTSKVSKQVELLTDMEAPGGPPQYVRVEAVDSTSFKVFWKPPRKDLWHGKVSGYKVGLRQHEADKKEFTYLVVQVDEKDEGEELSLQLNNLKKFTKYSVVLVAFNHLGEGPMSEEILARTAEDVPSKAPDGVQCNPISSQGVSVSWEPLTTAFIHGQIQGYKVLYKPVSDWYDDAPAEVKISQTWKTTLHGLEKFKNYSIYVLAFTRVGDGVRSNPVFCHTKEDVPEAPAEIKALVMSIDAVIVVWRPPSRYNGIVIKYTVYMRSFEAGKDETHKYIVSGNGTFTCERRNLKKNHRYEFWVTASTLVGEGQSTKPVSQTPLQRVPARIVAFDETIVARWQENVTLGCQSVGIPPPSVEWRFRDTPVQTTDRYHRLPTDSLLITRVQSSDAGLYTCRVQNIHGSDAVAYTMTVQGPPQAPRLLIISSTFTSIDLQWEPAPDGGSPIEGYYLYYKRDFGEWEMTQLNPRQETHSIDGLWCGTRYQIYLVAWNTIGSGESSDIKSIRTRGSAPEMPSKQKLVQENSSLISLNLDSWGNGGCSILYFVIEYRPQTKQDWLLVSNNVKVQQEKFLILDLEPGTKYWLRVTAHNSAGSTVAEYEFVTLMNAGASLPDGNVPLDPDTPQRDQISPFYLDVNITFPIVALMVLVIIVSISIFCWRKRRVHIQTRDSVPQPKQYEARYVASGEKKPSIVQSDFDKGSFTCLLVNTEGGSDSSTGNTPRNAKRVAPRDEIQPYATYQLPGCKTDRFTAEDWKRYEVYNPGSQTLRAIGSASVYPQLKKETSEFVHGHDSSLSDDQEYASPVRSSDTSDSTSGTNQNPEPDGVLHVLRQPPKPRKPGRRAKVPDLIYRRHGECTKLRSPVMHGSPVGLDIAAGTCGSSSSSILKIPRPQLERPTAPVAEIETTFSFLDKLGSSQESSESPKKGEDTGDRQTSSNSTHSKDSST